MIFTLKNSKKIIVSLLIFILIGFFSLVPITAFALNLKDAFQVNNNNAEDPLDKVAQEAGYDVNNADNKVDVLVSTIINIALSLLGVIFLALMVYGGYLWMTARGNEQQAEKARNLITAAVIGVVIVVAAYAITWFIISKVSSPMLKKQ